jgi:hypothetical protein
MADGKSAGEESLSDANRKILKNLQDRNILLKEARKDELEISPGAAVVLQTKDAVMPTSENEIEPSTGATIDSQGKDTTEPIGENEGEHSNDSVAPSQSNTATESVEKPTITGLSSIKSVEVLEAVEYRLAITDLFVEKAQYHLEDRAKTYRRLGYGLYIFAILLFTCGALTACYRMFNPGPKVGTEGRQQTSSPQAPVAASVPPVMVVLTQSAVAGSWVASQVPLTVSVPATAAHTTQSTTGAATPQSSGHNTWIDLLHGFIVSFTAYGFIVLTAVVLTRGARACLDQRERLLAKRHSLRQGRLYLHLSGGRVSIDDLERAFNWNHEQHNAFTNMPTDAKAPWGNVIEEIIKIVPELVKTGVSAAEKKNAPASKA